MSFFRIKEMDNLMIIETIWPNKAMFDVVQFFLSGQKFLEFWTNFYFFLNGEVVL